MVLGMGMLGIGVALAVRVFVLALLPFHFHVHADVGSLAEASAGERPANANAAAGPDPGPDPGSGPGGPPPLPLLGVEGRRRRHLRAAEDCEQGEGRQAQDRRPAAAPPVAGAAGRRRGLRLRGSVGLLRHFGTPLGGCTGGTGASSSALDLQREETATWRVHGKWDVRAKERASKEVKDG